MGLSADVVSKIQADWQKVGGDLESLGAALFVKMFTDRPGNMDYFKAFKGKSVDSIKGSAELKAQGARVLGLVDSLVKNAGNEDFLKGEVAKFSAGHKARNIPVDLIAGTKGELVAVITAAGGSNADAWNAFLDAFIAMVGSSY